MYTDPQEFIETMATPLGWLYLLACALNVAAAAGVWGHGGRRVWAITWLAVAAVFAALASMSWGGSPAALPERLKAAVDGATNPVTFMLAALVGLGALYVGRRWFVRPGVAWAGLNGSLLLLGLSLTDPEFAANVTQPDNVAVVGMVCLLAFFTWLAAAQAVENDRRLAGGAAPVEKQFAGKTLVWPDLVYIELIGMIWVAVLLVVWSLWLPAPLEPPANPALTPNPAKAPWYFVGLQELLVYSDAWVAGVVVPLLIVVGLAAIPYLDRNPRGNGYYTIDQRRFAYKTFQFGFLVLWILLFLMGTFMRGPNWSFFGPYEVRDPQKTAVLGSVKLSAAGLALWAVYFLSLPPLLGCTLLGRLRRELGPGRYAVTVLLLLAMLALPLKIGLTWIMNLSHLVGTTAGG